MLLRFMIFSMVSVSPMQLTWETLDQQQYHNRQVQIRGFLYQQPATDKMILASQPNLKSCCVGIGQHIVVEGSELSMTSNAVTLNGFFAVDNKIYVLKNAQLIEPIHSFAPWMIFVFVGIVLAAVYMKKRGKIKKQDCIENET